jgi:hypothetical protein
VCGTSSLAVKELHALKVFENKVLITASETKEVVKCKTGEIT